MGERRRKRVSDTGSAVFLVTASTLNSSSLCRKEALLSCDHGDLLQVCGMSLPRMGCGELSASYPIIDSRATSAGATLKAAKVPPAVQTALGGSLKNI